MNYAKKGLDFLKKGLSAKDTINQLFTEESDDEGIYQLLIMDKEGKIVCHTGNNNHNYAGSIILEHFAVAGNTLLDERTIQAVADYYTNSQEDFGIRIIHALQAGHKVGGDICGMKSAALKIVTPESSGQFWQDTLYDLRVDESDDPLKELERIYNIAEAYRIIGEAEEAETPEDAIEKFRQALVFDQKNTEILFWLAWNYHLIGNHSESKKIMDSLTANWHEYWKRLELRKHNN